MFRKNLKNSAARSLTSLLVGLMLFGQIFAQSAAQTALSSTEKEIAEKITVASIKDATVKLSSKEMEGRGTMQPGGDRAANWIAEQFQKYGLKPLGDKGSFMQKVDFKETTFAPETMFKIGEETLVNGVDYGIIQTGYKLEPKNASGDLVFVAYGIQSRGLNRDDLEGMNLKGKIVVMIDGPPEILTEEAWDNANARFAIFATLVKAGVAGIIKIAHGREKEPPETYISYLGRRDISLGGKSAEAEPVPFPPILTVSNATAAKLFSKAGISLKDALAKAEENSFKPIKLNQTAKIAAKYKTAKGSSNNVVGYIEGSDPKLKEEAVLFTAHYDAYGIENGKIYYGAADNALGTAEMLAVAEAYSKMKPKRSMIFLAVTGEEYGLYGSEYWSKNPTWDIKKVAANLNLDGVGTEVYGPVKKMVGYGAEHSTLGAMLDQVSVAYGIQTVPDPVPDEKVFVRSDHYSFVQRGVPALMLMGAPEGDIQDAMKRMKEWEKTNYHQPGDTIKDDWVWEGAETVAEVMGILGWRISETGTMPEWLPSSIYGKLKRGHSGEMPKEK